MKRFFSIAIMTFLFCYISAQDKYYPLVEEGKRWEIYNFTITKRYTSEEHVPYRTYVIKGDSVINDRIYKKLFVTCRYVYNDEESHYFAALSERDMRVYSIRSGSMEEQLLYDFNLMKDDTYNYILEESSFTEIEGNTLKIRIQDIFPWEDKDRTCWTGQLTTKLTYGDTSFCVLEGFGSFCDTFCPEYWIHPPSTELENIWCYSGEEEFVPNYPYVYPLSDFASTSTANGLWSIIFDLQGRRLTAEPQHGVFIKDGRKVMK